MLVAISMSSVFMDGAIFSGSEKRRLPPTSNKALMGLVVPKSTTPDPFKLKEKKERWVQIHRPGTGLPRRAQGRVPAGNSQTKGCVTGHRTCINGSRPVLTLIIVVNGSVLGRSFAGPKLDS